MLESPKGDTEQMAEDVVEWAGKHTNVSRVNDISEEMHNLRGTVSQRNCIRLIIGDGAEGSHAAVNRSLGRTMF